MIGDAEQRLALLKAYALQTAADRGRTVEGGMVEEQEAPPPASAEHFEHGPPDTLDQREPAPSVSLDGDFESCRIEWWRGYVKSQFHAWVTRADGGQYIVERSPAFRWRHSNPPPATDHALAAYGALVDRLVALGWQPEPDEDGRGSVWWAHGFRRTV